VDRRLSQTDDRWFSESESDKPTFAQLNRTKRRTDSAAFVDATAFIVPDPGRFTASGKHGAKAPRTWKKLRLAVDADTGMIMASTLTGNEGKIPTGNFP
jgi:hypothetical protein